MKSWVDIIFESQLKFKSVEKFLDVFDTELEKIIPDVIIDIAKTGSRYYRINDQSFRVSDHSKRMWDDQHSGDITHYDRIAVLDKVENIINSIKKMGYNTRQLETLISREKLKYSKIKKENSYQQAIKRIEPIFEKWLMSTEIFFNKNSKQQNKKIEKLWNRFIAEVGPDITYLDNKNKKSEINHIPFLNLIYKYIN